MLKFSNILDYSISGTRNLYLVMEYLPGGDLFSLLSHVGCLNEEAAKIYTYQIAVALSYLHSKGIIHRDIKPDNVLIAADGTIKLTDFGLSYVGITDRSKKTALSNSQEFRIRHSLSTENKLNEQTEHSYRSIMSHICFDHLRRKNIGNDNNDINNEKRGKIGIITTKDEKLPQTRSIVGTPDYIAPEILEGKEHSFAVDWWSLGVVLYEFLTGEPPFHDVSKEKIYQNIKECNYKPIDIRNEDEDEEDEEDEDEIPEKEGENTKPIKISEEAADLINKLLTLDPSKRLGSNSSEDVLNHKWFSDIDPSNIDIPFIPELTSEIDTTYFKQRYTFENTNDTDIWADIEDAKHPSSPFGNYRFRKRSSTQSEIHEQSLLVPQEASNYPQSLGKNLQRNERIGINNINSEINLCHIINSCSCENLPNFFTSYDLLGSPGQSNESSIKNSNSNNDIHSTSSNNNISNSNTNINLSSSNTLNNTYDTSSSNIISTNHSNENSSNAIKINSDNNSNSNSSNIPIKKRTTSSPYPENEIDDSLKNINEISKHIKGPRAGQVPLSPFKSSPTERPFIRYRRNFLSDNDNEKDQQNSPIGNFVNENSISNSSTPSILSGGPSDTNLHIGQISNNDYVDNDSDISSFPTVSLNDPVNDNEWTNEFISFNINALQKKNKELVNNRRSTSRLLKDENGNHMASNSFTNLETKNKEINNPKKRPSFSSMRMLSADDMYLPKFSGRNKSSYSRSNENSVDNTAIYTDSMENPNQDGNQNENQNDGQNQS